MLRNDTIADLLDEIETGVLAAGVVEIAQARRIAQCVLARMQQSHGGNRLYIPVPARATALQHAVLSDYAAGLSVRIICRRHHISRSRFYRILHTA